MLRVSVKPELLRWARERASLSVEDISKSFKKYREWERGEVQPTFKQLESFAHKTYVPIGYLFLQSPPREKIPIPDLRTVNNKEVRNPSPNLLDTIYLCQQRQEWYRNYAQMSNYKPFDFIGSVGMDTSIKEAASQMRATIGFDLETRKQSSTWTDALRQFIQQIDELGVMVMVSGVVGSNTNRKLAVEEFRGFALSDEYAPLVFINGSDSKAAQAFTLAHELAHIWLGKSALTDSDLATRSSNKIEKWCNNVAAEFLVPIDDLKNNGAGIDNGFRLYVFACARVG